MLDGNCPRLRVFVGELAKLVTNRPPVTSFSLWHHQVRPGSALLAERGGVWELPVSHLEYSKDAVLA